MKSIPPPPSAKNKDQPDSTSSVLQLTGPFTCWTLFHCPLSSFCLTVSEKLSQPLQFCYWNSNAYENSQVPGYQAYNSWNELLLSKKGCYFNTSVQFLNKAIVTSMYEILQLQKLWEYFCSSVTLLFLSSVTLLEHARLIHGKTNRKVKKVTIQVIRISTRTD